MNALPTPQAAATHAVAPHLRWGKRRSLWSVLVTLVLAMLVLLVWLASRYETERAQTAVEAAAAEAIQDVRLALARNLQNMQALQSAQVTPGTVGLWQQNAQTLLQERRELAHLEWRDARLVVLAQAQSSYRTAVFQRISRESLHAEVALNCANARRLGGPAYSKSYFLPLGEGSGQEVMDVCLPWMEGARPAGYVVATYVLVTLLSDVVSPQVWRGHEVSFTEADGTRLAVHGTLQKAVLGHRGGYSARQVLPLAGNTLMLRLDSAKGSPDLFPNVLTALVSFLALGMLLVLALLGRDTRRRLQAERDLAEALAFRKAMGDSLVTGLMARDNQGAIRYVNPALCKMVGFAEEDLLAPMQKARLSLPPTLNLPSTTAATPEGVETLFTRQDGTTFPALVFDSPLISAAGVQTGWMSAIIDVTEQRRAEALSRTGQERLQATARLATVGEMASLISHELNQPLAAISSYAVGSLNMLNAGLSPEELHGALQRISEQATRAGKVIKSVQNFVRRRANAREWVVPAELVEAVLPLVSLQAAQLGVSVHLSLAADVAWVLCDRTMLEQVLLNLARNAMQAMATPDCGVRELRLSLAQTQVAADPPSQQLVFTVQDTGTGMSQTVALQLFTPFFTTKQQGMGLGLSLCRTVVEQHGGKLEFTSSPGHGTIFTFTLPVRVA